MDRSFEIIEKDNGVFDAFALKNEDGHILQTFAWAGVKKCWKPYGVLAYDETGAVCGTLLLLYRKLPLVKSGILYAPRGPIFGGDRAALQTLTDGARQVAKKTGAYVVRMDPDIPMQDVSFMQNMASCGAELLPDAGELEHIQAQHVMRIDIAGKSREEVFAAFKPKTRYNIRLSVRRGVTVRAVGKEYLDDFTELMRQTGLRDGFATRGRDYFAAILENLGEHAKLFMAFDDAGVPLSGAIAAYGGGKMLYLYGASGNYRRECMPNYLMQWTMICWAIDCGCRIYDLRGVPANPETSSIAGLYRFKSGFGAQRVDFVGEYHIVCRPMIYAVAERLLPVAKRALCMANRIRNRLANGGKQKNREAHAALHDGVEGKEALPQHCFISR